MTFNIASKKAVDTAEIKIIDPDTGEQLVGGEGKLCSVTVYGPGTKPYLAAQSVSSARAMKRFQAKGNTKTTPEEDIAARASFLTAITTSFNGFDYEGMTDGAEAYRACYSDPGLGWLTSQVNAGAGDWANFTPDSSSN